MPEIVDEKDLNAHELSDKFIQPAIYTQGHRLESRQQEKLL